MKPLCNRLNFFFFTRNSSNICKTRYVHSSTNPTYDLAHINQKFETRNTLYTQHLQVYEQYLTALLQLYEQNCPGVRAILALVSVEEDFDRPLTSFIGFPSDELVCLPISPIVHPQQWGPEDPKMTEMTVPYGVLHSGVHPLLASILAPQVPEICLETSSFCLRYLQAGGHPFEARKPSMPLLGSHYFTRLKLRPWLSHLRNRRHRHSSGNFFIARQGLHSVWWDSDLLIHLQRKNSSHKNRIRVPLRFFSCRSEYSSNYDLWCTYQCALILLPFVLANAPPDSHLASIANNCIFNSFCTAYPQETRRAKKSITQYLSRCRPIRAIRERVVVDGMDGMDTD